MRRLHFLVALLLLCTRQTISFCAPSPSHRYPSQSSMKGCVYIATTLDGYLASEDGDVSFLDAFREGGPAPDDFFGFQNFLDSVDAIVMGRKTFEKVVSFGPTMWPYGSIPLVVWTRDATYTIPTHLESSVSVSNQSPLDLMETMDSKGYQRVYLDGGVTIQSFLLADLVDEMILSRLPVLLGSGIPLFASGGGETARTLEHLQTKSYPNGIVTSHYRVPPRVASS